MNLPHAPVYWITIQENFHDLVIATYGRGFWILDDITPIQQMTSEVMNAAAQLFAPRSAYRFQGITVPYASSDDPTAGQNPPYGASINYYSKAAPKSDPSIKIVDASGQTVRTLRGTRNPGLNRVWWDLRTEQSKEVRLRTTPAYAPELRLNADGWRPLPEGGRMSLLVPPGTYTVKLTIDGQEFNQPLTVLKDPNAGRNDADIQKQTAMLTELRRDIETAADMVNQIETIRGQLNALRGLVNNAEVKAAADDLDKKLIDIEDNLIQRKFTGQGQDTVRFPPKLISKINYLAGGVSSGDFPPNLQQREVHTMFRAQLVLLRKGLDDLVSGDVAGFNRMLRDKNIGNVITAAP
ncbi:MAG: hypothetical protein QOK48_679 [Blastocatellia bacterium]|nr:hypothetical protein [Blastocatellia bacterium]